MKITSESLTVMLNTTLQQVNETLVKEGKNYTVTTNEQKELSPKMPIFLEIAHQNKREPIGITHFMHLTPNCDREDFSKVARTTDELANSILKAIEIHESAKKAKDVIITSVGTPFFKNGHKIEIKGGILFINDVQIHFNNKPLEAHRLTGEEGLTFNKLQNGHFEVQNPIDQRKGKGIFFKMPSGEVYRG